MAWPMAPWEPRAREEGGAKAATEAWLKLSDRRAARIVKSCQDLPGQHLFQFIDADGSRRAVGSADVNRWLRDVSGRDITAKDFRTWAGTVLAAIALREFAAVDGASTANANVREAIERVARRLGNTPTICRKCYVHPRFHELPRRRAGAGVERRADEAWRRSATSPRIAVIAFSRCDSGGRGRHDPGSEAQRPRPATRWQAA
jgi:DNA topoisomerase IB